MAGKHWRCIIADSTEGTWSDDINVAVYGAPMVCESVSSEPNARLIAAAPEMSEALEAIANESTDGRSTANARALLARIRGDALCP